MRHFSPHAATETGCGFSLRGDPSLLPDFVAGVAAELVASTGVTPSVSVERRAHGFDILVGWPL